MTQFDEENDFFFSSSHGWLHKRSKVVRLNVTRFQLNRRLRADGKYISVYGENVQNKKNIRFIWEYRDFNTHTVCTEHALNPRIVNWTMSRNKRFFPFLKISVILSCFIVWMHRRATTTTTVIIMTYIFNIVDSTVKGECSCIFFMIFDGLSQVDRISHQIHYLFKCICKTFKNSTEELDRFRSCLNHNH